MELELLKGTIERIVFENEESGYTIARLSSRDYPNELVTVIGNLASANAGESVLLKGWWVNNPKYGRQFKIIEYQTVMPATLMGIKKYLGSGMIKGIGPVMAGRIVNYFGLDTFDVIENNPKKLRLVDGIGKKRIKSIINAWEEQREIKDIMVFLQGHGVSTAYAVKIYKTYESDSINVVREDPYQLADDVYGIGFKTADTIAQNLGIEKDSPSRIASGIKYVLSQKADDGHVYLPKQKLVQKCSEILDVDQKLIEESILELLHKEEIIQESVEKDEAIYLAPFYYAEVGVSNKIAALLKNSNPNLKSDDSIIAELESITEVHYSEKQREAIKKALSSSVLILTGGPGTGKTTTVLGMIKLFEKFNLRILLASPTGRAAKRLSEVTGYEAKTIHRLLEFSPQSGKFKRNAENPLETDVVIIDEMSMVDLILMNNLVKAIPEDATFIMVGDVDQLPSVGAGNVLKDLIDSGEVDVVRLTEIFRQASESLIITNAHRINKGVFPQTDGKTNRDFFFIEEGEPERVIELIQELVSERLPAYYGYHAMDDIQVICPMKRGSVGTNKLNKILQEKLNLNSQTIGRGSRNFRVGDKVMQIRNNYDYEVFNGDIGRIIRADRIQKEVHVKYPEKVVRYDIGDLFELELAYAITTHKSQGSEYRVIVMPLLTQHYMLLQRNLLYTGITRAKELVVLIGTKKALGMAINNNKIAKRYTSLAKRIKDACNSSVKHGINVDERGQYTLLFD